MKVRNWRQKCKDRSMWNEIVKQAKTHQGLQRRLKEKKNITMTVFLKCVPRSGVVFRFSFLALLPSAHYRRQSLTLARCFGPAGGPSGHFCPSDICTSVTFSPPSVTSNIFLPAGRNTIVNLLHIVHTACQPTLQHHNSHNRTENDRQ